MVPLAEEYRRLVEAEMDCTKDSNFWTEEDPASQHLDVMFFSSTTGEVLADPKKMSSEY